MSLTWHIAGKDLYRLRWVILLWVVAIVSEMVLAAIQATLDMMGHQLFFMASWTFGNVFIPIMGFGLVMGVQDDDPVTEGDAFWMTRPITGGRLLSAKALVVALLCAVPAIVTIPFWISHDFGLAALGRSSLQVLWKQALISILAVPFVVISSSGSNFVRNTLVGAVSLVGLVLVYRFLQDDEPSVTPDSVLVSRGWILLAVWIIAAACAALNQYHRRRTRLSVAILVTAALACFAVSKWWHTDLPLLVGTEAPAAAGNASLEISAHEGAHAVREGRMVRILSIIPDFSGTIVVEVSESEPEHAATYPEYLSELFDSQSAPEHYLLVSRVDGRAMTAAITRNPEELHAARLRYFRSTLVFTPKRDLTGILPSNMAQWIEGAVLVKDAGRNAGHFKLGETPSIKSSGP
jgi:hypothetical protein